MSDNIYSPSQQHLLLIACLLGLAGLILFGLGEYTTGFFGAGILFVVLRPWFHALVHRYRWNRQAATGVLLGFALVVIILPFTLLAVLLVSRIRMYAQDTRPIMAMLHTLEHKTGFTFTNEQTVRAAVQQGVGWLSKRLPSLAGEVLRLVVVIGLMLFALYFMYMEEGRFLRGLRRFLPFRAATLNELGESLRNNVNANVLGQALISLVQAALTGLLLWVFQVPDALFWGLVAFFTAFLPVLGTPLVWGPAALFKFAQGATGQGVGILLLGLVVVMNIDNLLRMVLARRIGNVHPLVTLAGVVLGVEIFGMLGLVIGPLLLSSFGVLLKVFERENRLRAAARLRSGLAGRPAPTDLL